LKKYIALLSVILTLALLFAGCLSGPAPRSVVTYFLSAMQAGEFEKAQYYLASKSSSLNNDLAISNDEFGEEARKKIFSHLKYDIKSQEISGDTAKVTATITSLDMVRVIGQLFSELMPMAFAAAFSDQSESDMDAMFEQYMMNAISDPNAPTTINDVVINLKKVDGQWLIEPDEKLANSLTGNLGNALSSFQ